MVTIWTSPSAAMPRMVWPSSLAARGTLRNGEGLPRLHALELELGAHEGHGADLAGNVDVMVGLYEHVQLYLERRPV